MSWSRLRNCLVMCLPLAGLLIGCSGSQQGQIEDAEYIEEHEHGNEGGVLALPELSPVDLNGRKLRVVATTSIIGDVVAQVGGEAIEIKTLMEPGQDPHSYEPGARELTAVADADVIFINGWDLEESLARDLENIGESVTVVPVSANIEPLAMTPNPKGIAGADPHVWMSIHNVERWTENISAVLSDLDAANAAIYAANVASYQVQLADLDAYAQEQLAAIPADRRVLVANHRAFSYFARDYELEMLGTVIPGFSSLAEPSADDLTDLIGKMENRGVCTIFTETAVGDQLAQVVAGELNFCDQVQVLPLYAGSLGPTDSPANTYIGMMRFNIDAIAQGLNMID